jgi:branched-chain amino acid transport system permease protein
VLPYLINGLVEGAIYALIALGYTMVYGILGMINFAHGEIYMLGGYAGILMIGLMVSSGVVGFSVVLALAIAFLFGIFVCAVWGATMERIAYRPLRNAPVLSPLISAIGSSFFLWNFVMVSQGNLPKQMPQAARGWMVNTRFPLTEHVSISVLEIGILLTALLMMGGLQLFIHKTRLGKAMRATAQDRTMASLSGIPINRVITSTFVIGSGLAAVAGIMFALYASVMSYQDGYLPGIKAFTAAVLGGIGNVPGAMLGGFVLGTAENLAMWEGSRVGAMHLLVGVVAFSLVYYPLKRARPDLILARWLAATLTGAATPILLAQMGVALPGLGFLGRTDYKHVYAFVILMLVLIFRPRGILGERVSEKV